MNPLSTHYLSAEHEYRQQQIADDMAAAAWWSRLIRTGSLRALHIARRRTGGTPSVRSAPWLMDDDGVVVRYDEARRANNRRATVH